MAANIKKTMAFIIFTAMACLLFAGVTIGAANDGEPMIANITDTSVSIENIPNEGTVIVAAYDSSGTLSGVKLYEIDGDMEIDFSDDLPNAETIKAFVWDMATITPLSSSAVYSVVNNEEAPIVYMTSEISSEAIVEIYNKLGVKLDGNVGVKLSTGEAGDTYYLSPDLIKDLVQSVNGTIVECNTAYGGSRSSTAMHMQVAADHGFTDIADVDILDADGSMTLQVNGGTRLSENYVGSHFANYDSYLVLSHFKGHAMAGFGGAMKNISIGFGSRQGKCWIHTSGNSTTSPWGGEQDPFLESMAEAAKSVDDYMGDNIVYINVMNNLSVDCDCDSNPAEPTMADIGILASTDPLALDQACIDLVYAADDGEDLINRIESRNGLHILEHAEEIGLGSREYRLVNIDE